MARLIVASLLALSLLSPRSFAQVPAPLPPAPGEAPSGEMTSEEATRRLAELETLPLEEARRTVLTGLWLEVIARLQEQQAWLTQADPLRRLQESAQLDRDRALSELAALPLPEAAVDLGVGKGASASEVGALADEAEAVRAASEAEVARLRDERTMRSDRLREIPGLIGRARASLDLLVAPELEVDDPLEAEVRRTVLASSRQALQAQIGALEVERSSYEARRDTLTARQDLAQRRLTLAQSRAAALHAAADQRRLSERAAEALAAEAALLEARTRHPVLAAVAERVTELSKSALSLEGLQNRDQDLLLELRSEIDRITTEYDRVKGKVEKLGFSNALGQILRRNRNALPEPEAFAGEVEDGGTSEAQELLLQLEDERAELVDLDRWVVERLRREGPDPQDADADQLKADLRTQVVAYRDKLDAVLVAAGERFELLAELDSAHASIRDLIEAYARFIDERILWVPDARPVALGDFEGLGRGLSSLFSTTVVERLTSTLGARVRARPASAAAWVLLFLGLLMTPGLLRRRMAPLAEEARRDLGHIRPSLQAFGLTLVRAVCIPLALWIAGNRLAETQGLEAMGDSLDVLARAAFLFSLLSATCSRDGLGARHFRWPGESCVALRRLAQRGYWVLVPLLVPFMLASQQDKPAHDASLERMLLGLLALAIGWFSHGALKDAGPVAQTQRVGAGAGFGSSLRVWSHAASMVFVVVLLGLQATGYLYASQVLMVVWLDTVLLALVLVIARGMGLLTLAVQARHLRVEQRRRAREAAGSEAEVASLVEEEAGIDVALVSGQARQLMRAGISVVLVLGLAAIWAEVLPAITRLDEITIYERSFEAAVLPEGGGEAVQQVVTDIISLSEVLYALLVMLLTIVAVRNLPGLLDIAVLSRIDMQPGSGYAIKTITRYLLVFSGTVLVLGQLGVTWGSMQWLVAAMSVGLGFGLQEVFANFVCGLILLFERPVRVGDVVSVGGAEGVVTRIQIRATTVRDWNRREMLIPNRRFVTEEVTNLTLTDPITRLVFPVGVAYGSDTELATKTLLQVAAAFPQVLDTPEPSVVFRRFGDSSLDFDLRAFLSDFDDWATVTHGVNMAIDKAFRDRGIEIAFPQRDVHIRVKELGAAVGARGREVDGPSPR
jgi:potassium efflux system protein